MNIPDWNAFADTLQCITPTPSRCYLDALEQLVQCNLRCPTCPTCLECPDNRVYATYVHEERYVVNQAAVLGEKDGLKFYDVPLHRHGDVIVNLQHGGAFKATLVLNGCNEEELAPDLVLLMMCMMYQSAHIRIYFSPDVTPDHAFWVQYTGWVLDANSRRQMVTTREWYTPTHRYKDGLAFIRDKTRRIP